MRLSPFSNQAITDQLLCCDMVLMHGNPALAGHVAHGVIAPSSPSGGVLEGGRQSMLDREERRAHPGRYVDLGVNALDVVAYGLGRKDKRDCELPDRHA